MYTLVHERWHLKKELLLQVLFLAVAFLLTERFVDYLVEERRIFPESFTLESLVFMGSWFTLDLVVCSIFRLKSIPRSFAQKRIAQVTLPSLGVSWVVAESYFKFYSFGLECISMLGLWFVLDFVSNKLIGRSRTH